MKRLLPPFDLGWLLIAVVGTWVLAIAEVDIAAIRLPLGLVAALIGPGYSLVAAAAPDLALSRGERLLVVLGLSLACGVVLTLVLVAIGAGLHATAWASGVLVVSLIGAAIASWRHPNGPRWLPHPPAMTRIAARNVVLLVISGLVAIGGIVAATAVARHARGRPYTELAVTRISPTAARIVVSSNEAQPLAFRLIIESQTGLVDSRFVLDPGSSWSTTSTVPARSARRLEATLYRLGEETPYRTVYLSPAVGATG